MANSTRVGEAYAFFDTDKTVAEIEREMPNIRKEACVPKGLELSVMETNELAKQPQTSSDLLKYISQTELRPIYSEAQRHLKGNVPPKPIRDLKYAIRARGLDSNAEVASYLAHASIYLGYEFDGGKPFNGVVVGNANEDGGEDFCVYEN